MAWKQPPRWRAILWWQFITRVSMCGAPTRCALDETWRCTCPTGEATACIGRPYASPSRQANSCCPTARRLRGPAVATGSPTSLGCPPAIRNPPLQNWSRVSLHRTEVRCCSRNNRLSPHQCPRQHPAVEIAWDRCCDPPWNRATASAAWVRLHGRAPPQARPQGLRPPSLSVLATRGRWRSRTESRRIPGRRRTMPSSPRRPEEPPAQAPPGFRQGRRSSLAISHWSEVRWVGRLPCRNPTPTNGNQPTSQLNPFREAPPREGR